METPEISLPATPIFSVAGIAITNAVLAAFLIGIALILTSLLFKSRISLIPGRFQLTLETLVTFFLDQLKSVYGSEKRARKHLPYVMTTFLFIFLANQFGIFPLINSIITGENTSLFRTPTSHFSLPVAMAIPTIIGCNIIAFANSPLRYIGKFINIKPLVTARSIGQFAQGILYLFIGLLDIVGEVAKLVSISARLFGNVFAGEIMIVIIASLSLYTQFLVPVPFMILSIVSGIIQAFVFTLLTLNYAAGILPETKHVNT